MITKEVPNRLYTILNSSDCDPLNNWSQSDTGCIQVVEDDILKKNVVSLDTNGNNACTFIMKEFNPDDESPAPKLPCLSILVRTVAKKHFTCDVEMLTQPYECANETINKMFILTTDKRQTSSNNPKIAQMKRPGWNCVVLQLADICSQFFQSHYVRTTKIRVNANCRLYKAYFSDRLYDNDELPEGYRLFSYDSTTIDTLAE